MGGLSVCKPQIVDGGGTPAPQPESEDKSMLPLILGGGIVLGALALILTNQKK